MKLALGHIELFVKNPVASIPFYADGLGAEIVAVQDETFVWLKLGEVELLLRPGNPAPVSCYAQSMAGLVLYVDNLETAVYQLKGYGIKCHLMDEPDCYTFQDPDGHWFQLVDPSTHE